MSKIKKFIFGAVIFFLFVLSAFLIGNVTSEYVLVYSLRYSAQGLLSNRYANLNGLGLYTRLLADNILRFPQSLITLESIMRWEEFDPGGCAYYEKPQSYCKKIELTDQGVTLELCDKRRGERDKNTQDLLIESSDPGKKLSEVSIYKDFDAQFSKFENTVILGVVPYSALGSNDLWLNVSGESNEWIYSMLECDEVHGAACHISRICVNRYHPSREDEINIQL